MAATKVRPALCLTDPIGFYRHIIVAFVSSQVSSDFAVTDIVLHRSRPDFGATGLRVDSVVRLHRLVTLTSRLIRRDMGQLSQPRRDEVD